MLTGTIIEVEDHGSIVIVWLETELGERPVYFDHRSFQTMHDGLAGELVGEEVVYCPEEQVMLLLYE